jgi:hypothetical protein
VPSSYDGHNIANHSASGGRDNTDALWKGWQRPFARCVEESFFEQASFELFEGQLERSGTPRLHCLGNNLKLAAALIDRYAATNQYSKTIRRAEL